ncbi:Uncharacterized conserved protein [Mycobacteroides abscessus subsp. abscessus]|uniref:threonine/serine ThrE exporter family protein n=1 Tax=Mycobacteroides abscessus TaxID=36809 RepID=UPI0009A718D7|nr:threonine/serine exporter family protein [Mycobacteroides abscessus]SLF51887.1 Uncharacterized conserved protein [Mycobacteroides abscessus subsp. abscessus]
MTALPRRGRALALVRKTLKDKPVPLADARHFPDAEVVTMLRMLGIAMLEVGQPTNLVLAKLHDIAPQYTDKELRAVVLPTVLIIQIDGVTGQLEVEESTRNTAQLDQAGHIDAIADMAVVGAIAPADAIARIYEIRCLKPRFGTVLTVVGHTILTLGFGLALAPTSSALPAYLVLGLIVGVLMLATNPMPTLAATMPAVAAFVVTVISTLIVANVPSEGLARVLAPALIAVLPGMTLTIGALELTSTQLMAGSTRIVYGIAQLMLLALGVVIGVKVAGPPEPSPLGPPLGSWTIALAVPVIAVGFYLYKSAPRGSLIWLVLAIGVAMLGQRLGSLFLAPAMTGFVGAVAVVPFALFAARFRGAPSAIVLLLAAFWCLVPGALSFVNVSEVAATGHANLTALLDTCMAIFSIALGLLVGASLHRGMRYALAVSR